MNAVNEASTELAIATMEYFRVKAQCDKAGAIVSRTQNKMCQYAYAAMCDAQNDFAAACAAHVASE